MKNLLTLSLLVLACLTSQAQYVQPAPKRFWRAGDYVKINNVAGTSPETYDSRNVSIIAFKGALIRVMIGNASDYYTPSQFLSESGQPYGNTAVSAVDAWAQTSPVVSGTGVAGVSSINGKNGALTGIVETTGSYSDPSFILNLNAAKVIESATRRFLSDSKINQYDGYATSKVPYADTVLFVRKQAGTRLMTNAEGTKLGSLPATVQAQLLPGTNIKNFMGNSLLGSGNITISKSDIGLPLADNTPDSNKPVSVPQQLALDAKQPVITSQVDIAPRNITVNGTLTAPTPTTGTANDAVATTKFTYDEVMRLLRDTLLAQYKPLFDANQFAVVDTTVDGKKISFIRIKAGLITGSGSTTATSGTAVTGLTALTFIDAGLAAPIVAVDSSGAPLRYYKGGSLVDWDSGPNSGVSNTRLPANTEGYVSARYFPMTDFAVIGFDSVGGQTNQRKSQIQAGFYFTSDGHIGTAVQGRTPNEVVTSTVAAAGSYTRIRRTSAGKYDLEYSPDGTSYTVIASNIRSTVPGFVSSQTALYAGMAIHFNGRIYRPASSTNFVTY